MADSLSTVTLKSNLSLVAASQVGSLTQLRKAVTFSHVQASIIQNIKLHRLAGQITQ